MLERPSQTPRRTPGVAGRGEIWGQGSIFTDDLMVWNFFFLVNCFGSSEIDVLSFFSSILKCFFLGDFDCWDWISQEWARLDWEPSLGRSISGDVTPVTPPTRGRSSTKRQWSKWGMFSGQKSGGMVFQVGLIHFYPSDSFGGFAKHEYAKENWVFSRQWSVQLLITSAWKFTGYQDLGTGAADLLVAICWVWSVVW